MNKKELKELVRQTLKEFGHTTEKVAVEINGEVDYYTEREVRALQIIAKRKAEESEEAFKEFCDSVTVYKGRYKGRKRDKSDRVMPLCRDGYFDEEFDPGFFDTTYNLRKELWS